MSSLPPGLGNLGRLLHLRLAGCRSLSTLPESFVNLHSLEKLSLKSCLGLRRLPVSFGALVNLSHLDLSECYGLIELPDSFSSLSLQTLIATDLCPVTVADRFGKLSSLRELDVSSSSFMRWPYGLEMIRSLEKLTFNCCPVTNLPDNLRSLSNLTQIALRSCTSLCSLCDDFGCVSNLKQLDLFHCTKLLSLPPSFSNLTSLQILDLSHCQLENLPTLAASAACSSSACAYVVS